MFTINAHDLETTIIAFAPDGTQLLTSDGATLKLWDVPSLLRPQGFTSPGQCHINKIAFSLDGAFLAAGEKQFEKICLPRPFLSVWEVNTGKTTLSIAHSGSIAGLSLGLDQHRVVLGRLNGLAEIWDSRTAQKHLTYPGHADPETLGLERNVEGIYSLSISPDRQMIATGDVRKTVKLWTPQGQEIRTIRGPGKIPEKGIFTVFALDFSHHGKFLAVGGDDPSIDLYNPQTGEKILSLTTESKAIHVVQFSPDDRWIAAAGNDGLIRIWSVGDGQLRKTLRGHSDLIYDLAWTPDGTRLASASKDKTVRLWNPADSLEVMAFREHTDQVSTVAFSPDGTVLASGSWDGTVRLRRASIHSLAVFK